jgi:hypothetical protein
VRRPDPDPVPTAALLFNSHETVARASISGIFYEIAPVGPVTTLTTPAADTAPATVTIVKALPPAATTTPLGDAPAPYLAGEPPAQAATGSTQTGAEASKDPAADSMAGTATLAEVVNNPFPIIYSISSNLNKLIGNFNIFSLLSYMYIISIS